MSDALDLYLNWLSGTPCGGADGELTTPLPPMITPQLITVPQWFTSTLWGVGAPTFNGTQFYCPWPWGNVTLTYCCVGNATLGPYCCRQPASQHFISSGSMRWLIGTAAVVGCLILCIAFVLSFNKISRVCFRNEPDSIPRPKITINRTHHTIAPTDKRVLFKTGNYTVERSWEVVTVRFYSRDFYDNFKQSLMAHYPALSCWRDPRKRQDGQVTDSRGLEVCLTLNEDSRSLVVTDEGAVSWVMSDFQLVCKNVNALSGYDASAGPPGGSLSPRQPTIGEEDFSDAGDYRVRLCQTEIEIKFASESLFDSFKRLLLGRYDTVPWTKYLQRDCAQIRLDSGKTVTVHLWEDIRSVWLSGDGKKDWYTHEFQQIHSIAKRDADPCNPLYTVKTLYLGGYEVEFPTVEFLLKIKSLLEERYSGLVWTNTNHREQTNLVATPAAVSNGSRARPVKVTKVEKLITVQLGNTALRERKMWINGDHVTLKHWLGDELATLYRTAYDKLYTTAATELTISSEV